MAKKGSTGAVANIDEYLLEYERPYLYPKQMDAIFDSRRYSFIEASTKAGKAQPLDALVYTPRGPKRMGDVAVGDVVLTPGGSGNVVAVYPQGEREILKVTFSDGAVVEADADHLWEVHQFNQKPVVVTTEQLQAWKPYKLSRAWVPEAECAQFDPQPVPLDPYLVGALIGDGGLTHDSVMISNEDEEILGAVRAALPPGHTLRHSSRHDWRITGGSGAAQLREDGVHIQRALRDLGLAGKGSHEKFVPEIYRYNSRAVRLAVLQGILDTDGFVDKHGQPGIEQTSQRLSQDIEELVQSLGGTVLTRLRAVNGYRAKDGRFVTCRPVWRQVIRVPDGRELFSLERKRARCKPKRKTGHRMFRSIEFSRRAPAQCIELDTERQLYLTNGMVPTHNTSGCIVWIFEQALHGQEGWNYWWVAPVSGQADIAFRRCLRAIPQDMRTENMTLKTITLINGAVIWFKSADKPDSLYGEDVYAAVMDEASRTKEDAWFAVRSTLTATRGPIRIIGNVKGRRNWFYQLARKAEKGEEENFGYHKITAIDAIAAHVLDKEEVADAKKVLPDAVFKELYLAEPSDDQGNPFGLKAIALCANLPGIQAGNSVVHGLDFAKKQDWTVDCGLDEYGRLTKFMRMQVGWETQIPLLKASIGVTPTLADSTGVGDPIVERLQKTPGSKVEGYIFSSQSKQRLMEGLALAIQSGEVSIPDAPDGALPYDHPGNIKRELELFEYEYTRIGVRYCLAPATRVLTSDLRWQAIGDCPVGQEFLAFDEFAEAGHKARRWRTSRLEASAEIVQPTYRITLDDGTVVEASENHLWLVNNAGQPQWRRTADLKPHHASKSNRFAATQLIRATQTWQPDSSWEAGYLAAAFDGEGSLYQGSRKDHRGNNLRLSFAQRDNEMAQQVRDCLNAAGFEWSEHRGLKKDCGNIYLKGRRHEQLRFLGQYRPRRLLPKFDGNKIGTFEAKSYPKVETLEYMGQRTVIATKTTSGTLVAEGLASHNCAPEGFHDDCVMALALAVMHRTHARLPMKIGKGVLAKAAGMRR